MIRSFALALCLAVPAALLASPNPSPDNKPGNAPAASAASPITGVVADPTGAIVPNAEIELVDPTGAVDGSFRSGGDGSFQIEPPRPGNYTLVISEPGFTTIRTPVVATTPAYGLHTLTPLPAVLHIVLPIATLSTNIHVSADSNEDLTAGDDNHDTSVMTSNDLKNMPIFDNDYVTAMSAFLDTGSEATGGAGLIVDGVESDRVTVSASAVKEVIINQDPYSAQYYWPGRGQMEIITKSAADHYHGQTNFYFRDSALNAQNALAPSKPSELRQIYEGSVTGPIFFAHHSSFLGSFNHATEQNNAVVDATVAPTPTNPDGIYTANVPTPTDETDFSIRAAHQFGDKHSAYAQYSYYNWTGQNQNVGGQTLQQAGYNAANHEDDFTIHVNSILSPELLNQFSVVAEHGHNIDQDANEGPVISVNGYYTGGSAQADSLRTWYNFRLYDMASWTHGRNYIKAGIGIPNLTRIAYDDHTNEDGSYSFAPTMAADGVTVLQTALQNYDNNIPSGFSAGYGDSHFIYHQQEAGAFIQDQVKISSRFSVTPGLRYDWQNFLAQKRLGFSPRVSFAYVLDPQSKTVLRGGGGIYYDRFGSWPMLDLVRYQGVTPRRRTVSLSLNPATQPPSGCYPISNCIDITTLPVNRVQLMPGARIPYQIQYGISIERAFGEKSTLTASTYAMRMIGDFRSVDINAPTPESDYTVRPNPDYLRIRQMQPEGFIEGDGADISYQGRYNKWFSGWGRYTWSHYASNTDGITWFPQNQYDPNDEWSNASWDRRNRLGFYGMFNPRSVLNLSGGVFANSGTPWTILTGTDPYGDDLFNARPDGVGRYTENLPPYVDLDLRWGHDFALTADKDDDSPHLGFSASSFNVLNHPSVGSVDTVDTSPTFGEETSADNPRRIQLAMRFEF